MYTVLLLDLEYAFTAVTGVHMLMTMHKDQSLNHAIYRIVGPLVTLVVGIVLVPVFWAMPGVGIILTLLYCLFMARGYVLGSHPYARMWAMLSMLFLIYIAATRADTVTTFVVNWSTALVVGVVYTYIAVMLIWPSVGAELRQEFFDFSDEQNQPWVMRTFRITTTAMLSLGLALMLELEGGLSLTISAVVCSLTEDGQATLQKAKHRLVGVVVGAGHGLLCLILLAQFGHLTILIVFVAIGMAVFCYIGLANQAWRYPFAQAGLVLALVTMPMTAPIGSFQQATDRLVGILIGVVVAFTVWAFTEVYLVAMQNRKLEFEATREPDYA